MTVPTTEEILKVLREGIEHCGVPYDSVTLYGSAAIGRHHDESDIDVLFVAAIPSDAGIDRLHRYLWDRTGMELSPFWSSTLGIVAEAVDTTSVVSAALTSGRHVVGRPLADYIPSPFQPFDEIKAAQKWFERSRRKAAEIRGAAREGAAMPNADLAAGLLASAGAVLISHGLGRLKSSPRRLDASMRKLETVVDRSAVQDLETLHRSLQREPLTLASDRDCSEGSRLIEIFLQAAESAPTGGATRI